MSRAGERSPPAGFTLVELLVVLAIIALALGVSMPFLAGGTGPRLEALAATVAGALREARGEAVVGNREVVLLIDPDARTLGRGEDGDPLTLPGDVTLTLTAARSEMVDESVGGIRFFADGSSTGGVIALARDGRNIAVRVDWLSGRVRVEGGP